MTEQTQPGRQAYAAFIMALGLEDHWDELPERSRVAWFSVECRCARLPVSKPVPTSHATDGAGLVKDILEGFNSPAWKELAEKARQNGKRPAPTAAGAVGCAVIEDESQRERAFRYLAPDSWPRFSHVIGIDQDQADTARADAHFEGHTTIQVDMGDHPVSGRYILTSAAAHSLSKGNTVQLFREPGHSIEASPHGKGLLPSELADQVRDTLKAMMDKPLASPPAVDLMFPRAEEAPPLERITFTQPMRDEIDRLVGDLANRVPGVDPDQLAEAVDQHVEHMAEAYGVASVRAPSGPSVTADVAKAMGTFTGDSCGNCGSFAVTRTGKCTTCQECGATGGCG
jgi:hypothetical protein